MKDSSEPAFPFTPHPDRLKGDDCDPGMSLRDWFAGMMLAQCAQAFSECNPLYADQTAMRCYAFADAMLRRRQSAREEPT
jgi:hypothetical protein